MIKVSYMDDRKLLDWYWNEMKDSIKTGKTGSADPSEKTGAQEDTGGNLKIADLWRGRMEDQAFLRDLLTTSRTYLLAKYPWVGDYMKQCFQNQAEEDNREIEKYLSYDKLKIRQRRELVSRMNVKVCPYCNQQYIYALEPVSESSSERRYMADLDHVLPKSRFPLFCLSLWNLVPACKCCNQIFKRDLIDALLPPTEAGFDGDAALCVDYETTASVLGLSDDFSVQWKLRPGLEGERAERIRNNLSVFQLDDLYGGQKEEIRRILWKKAVFTNDSYLKGMEAVLKDLSIPASPEFILFGIDSSGREIPDTIHGKMIFDLVYGDDSESDGHS